MTRRTGRAAVCAALAFGLAAGGAPSAFAETIHVAAGGDIAAAVERANNDDVVELAPGTYMLSATVTVDKPITVRGRFAACTTVTASGTGYSLFKLTDEGAVLERVTLTGATATSGAGVYVTKGTVRDAVVVGNRATKGDNAGAGVWLSGTGCAVRRCRIEKNSTGGYGGGIYAAGASVIESCSLTGNSASYGGGIYCDQASSVIVAQCTLWMNRSSNYTSDIYDWNAWSVRYVNCAMSESRKGAGVMTGCLVTNVRTADELAGRGVALTGETALEKRDIAGCAFHSENPSVGCTEFATDGLRVNWTGASSGECGTQVVASFEYENVTEGMNVATALYDAAGTRVGGSDEGADFCFVVTDEIGVYTLVVTVTANGETWGMFQNPFTGGPSELHVSRSGTCVSPYATEETALTDIQTAVDLVVPGGTVIVHDGEYPLADTLRLERPVTVRSANGRATTTLKPLAAEGVRLVYINNAAATLDGFTLTGGRTHDGLTGNSHGGGAYVGTLGGTVDNCLIEKCGVGYSTTHGVAVRLSAPNAVLRRTIIRRNEGDATTMGSVYVCSGGIVDNCLIYDNGAQWGAGVYVEGGASCVILNSTIQDNNRASGSSGKDVYACGSVCAVTNSIYGNFLNYHGGCVCTFDRCLETALFVDRENGDYTPKSEDETVVDQGVVYEGMPETDVLGNPRISGGGVDIGAVEVSFDKLSVKATVDRRSSLFSDGLAFTVTPVVSGATGEVSLDWRITTDRGRRTALVKTTPNEPLVFAPAEPGAFTVEVSATDEREVSPSVIYEKMFVAGAGELFVDAQGGDVYPYVSAEAAAHDLKDVWEMATSGSVVRVAAGIYRIANALDLSEPIHVIGAGRDRTTIRLADNAMDRVAKLNDPGALISGCTLSGGRADGNGCGVYFGTRGGVVEDCRITDNRPHASFSDSANGSVAFASSSQGLLRRSVVDGNSANYGGGIYAAGGGVVDNCLICSNSASYGGGIYLDGRFYATNCTVIGNSASARGPAIYAAILESSRFANMIVRPRAGLELNYGRTTNGVEQVFSHCAIERVGNKSSTYEFPELNGNTHALPVFVDEIGGDYHQRRCSPLRNVGLVTLGLKALSDLDGQRRVSNGAVDLGCYQVLNGGLLILVE